MSLPTFIVWLLIVIIGDIGLFMEVADWVQTGDPINFNYLFIEGESTAIRVFGIVALIVGNIVVLYYSFKIWNEGRKRKQEQRKKELQLQEQLQKIKKIKR